MTETEMRRGKACGCYQATNVRLVAADQTYAAYLKAAAILEKMFVKYPDHPGVAHYLIHSYDAPPIAGHRERVFLLGLFAL